MYALKEMHKLEAAEQIIYLSQHTSSGMWRWDVVDGVTACGFAGTRSLAFSEALVAAGWVDVEYWRRLAG